MKVFYFILLHFDVSVLTQVVLAIINLLRRLFRCNQLVIYHKHYFAGLTGRSKCFTETHVKMPIEVVFVLFKQRPY